MFVHEYDDDDEIKLWILITHNECTGTPLIHAFSDDKDLFNAYRSIHNKELFDVRTVKGFREEIMKIVNSNLHAELEIVNLSTRSKDGKSTVLVPVPMTVEEENTFHESVKYMSFNGNDELYVDLYNNVQYLEEEYREALMILHLHEMCNAILGHPGSMEFFNSCEFDELRFFCKVHAETF